jgi:carbon-monoxide dehydrogenase medium subunit
VKPPPFEYRRPASLEEALADLAAGGEDAKVLAGGQSLVPMLAFRLARPSVLVDINRTGLDRLEVTPDGIRVEALVRQRDLEREGPAPLPEALRLVAHPAIRNRGTVVGSICHADPAAELPAVALALDGELEIHGPSGRRLVPAVRLFTGPLTTVLEASEVATAVRLHPPAGWRWRVLEVSRRAGDFALVGVVAGTSAARDVGRVAVFGAGPTAFRVDGHPEELAELAMAACRPVDDIHAPAGYRRGLVGELTRRALAV